MSKNLKPPKELVAKALEISVEQLNENSAYGETPNWDSLNHVSIINELEANYSVQIPDSEIENYLTMKNIIQLYEKMNK
jgi:acyl carrier protein